MTDPMPGGGLALAPGPRHASPAKARSYARLAKLDIIDYYLGVLVTGTLLAPAAWSSPRDIALLAVFLAGEVLVVASMVAFDDVTGYRDGSDAANYGPDAPLRRLARKPLIAGTLTEAQAIRFGRLTATFGTLVWAALVVLAPHRPLWAIAVLAGCLVTSIQYSWGLKLSYHGFQEIFLIGLGVGLVLAPYGLATGAFSGFAAVQAVLFGFGPLLFGVFSNTNDIAGDARVGRRTVAVLASARGNGAFITAVACAETAVIVGAVALRVAPWWFVLALLPVIALRGTGLWIGLRRGDILRARNLGIKTHRVCVAALIVVNLIHPFVAGGLR